MTQKKSRAPEEQPWTSYSSLHGENQPLALIALEVPG